MPVHATGAVVEKAVLVPCEVIRGELEGDENDEVDVVVVVVLVVVVVVGG